ncbi:MAG: 2,3-dehydroadipyl-CoA hydratase [Thiothrix sp.]|nr:2,3-dehydroadipyl-CoA hydratase [Thiothrix sp.]
MDAFEDITPASPQAGVLLLSLNRPEVRNALRTQTLAEIATILDACTHDDAVRCVVITGDRQAFAAGADIREMAALDMVGVMHNERPRHWARIRRFPKPLIAAVNGYCLGGGCELAMHADIIIAGHDARFGQPEINLGIIPGSGGTQRLIRAVGKSLGMKMVLSGEMIDAATALQAGLVAELTEPELTLETALALAATIATKPPLAVRLAKEALLQAFESSLSAGLEFERKAFVMLAATDDRREGMAAFSERRKPEFQGR